MPLVTSTTDLARSKNIATEVKVGKPVKQAVAIGYAQQRRAKTLDEVKADRRKKAA